MFTFFFVLQLALSDRMDLTLKRYLELQENEVRQGPGNAVATAAAAATAGELAASAADYALMEEIRAHEVCLFSLLTVESPFYHFCRTT